MPTNDKKVCSTGSCISDFDTKQLPTITLPKKSLGDMSLPLLLQQQPQQQPPSHSSASESIEMTLFNTQPLPSLTEATVENQPILPLPLHQPLPEMPSNSGSSYLNGNQLNIFSVVFTVGVFLILGGGFQLSVQHQNLNETYVQSTICSSGQLNLINNNEDFKNDPVVLASTGDKNLSASLDNVSGNNLTGLQIVMLILCTILSLSPFLIVYIHIKQEHVEFSFFKHVFFTRIFKFSSPNNGFDTAAGAASVSSQNSFKIFSKLFQNKFYNTVVAHLLGQSFVFGGTETLHYFFIYPNLLFSLYCPFTASQECLQKFKQSPLLSVDELCISSFSHHQQYQNNSNSSKIKWDSTLFQNSMHSMPDVVLIMFGSGFVTFFYALNQCTHLKQQFLYPKTLTRFWKMFYFWVMVLVFSFSIYCLYRNLQYLDINTIIISFIAGILMQCLIYFLLNYTHLVQGTAANNNNPNLTPPIPYISKFP